MAKSNEPLWWIPFMGGAVVSAFLMPITIVVVGILSYFWWLNEDELWDLLQNPWVRAFLFILIALSLFHGFHRILYVLIDLLQRGAWHLVGRLVRLGDCRYSGGAAGGAADLVVGNRSFR